MTEHSDNDGITCHAASTREARNDEARNDEARNGDAA
jgi:hypothetical protein